MSDFTQENIEAIEILLQNYKDKAPKIKARMDKLIQEKKNNKLIQKNRNTYKDLQERIEKLETNPESMREFINKKKQKIKENRFIPPYPEFPTKFSNNISYEYNELDKLIKAIKLYKKYEGKTASNPITVDKLQNVIEIWIEKVKLSPEDYFIKKDSINSNFNSNFYYTQKSLEEILNYYEIKHKYEEIIKTNYEKKKLQEDYALYINVGSGGTEHQWVPQDESFKANVLGKYKSHLFFIFDKTGEGWKNWSNLFLNETHKPEETKEKIKSIERFFGVQSTFTKFSENCVEYSFKPIINNDVRDIRLVFLNSWLTNLGYFALEPLIQKASLKIVTCTKWEPCMAELFQSPYILNHFDYYITNHRSHNSKLTELNRLSRKEGYRYMIDLESLRSSKIGIELFNSRDEDRMNSKTLVEKGHPTYIKENVAASKGISFKKKGNSTFWNNMKRGGAKTRKTKKN